MQLMKPDSKETWLRILILDVIETLPLNILYLNITHLEGLWNLINAHRVTALKRFSHKHRLVFSREKTNFLIDIDNVSLCSEVYKAIDQALTNY